MRHISMITAAILAFAVSSCEENVRELLPESEIPTETTTETTTETGTTTETTTEIREDEGSTTAVVRTTAEGGVGAEPSENSGGLPEDDFNGFTSNERSTSLEEIMNENGGSSRMGSTRNTVEVVNVNGMDVLAPESENTDPASIVSDIETLVNNHRASVGANALTLDAFISNLAAEHSRNVAAGTATALDGFSDRQNAVSIQFNIDAYGENTAENQTNGAGAVAGWLNNPRQRQEIENQVYTHTGIGSYQDAETGTIYYTQIFVEIN